MAEPIVGVTRTDFLSPIQNIKEWHLLTLFSSCIAVFGATFLVSQTTFAPLATRRDGRLLAVVGAVLIWIAEPVTTIGRLHAIHVAVEIVLFPFTGIIATAINPSIRCAGKSFAVTSVIITIHWVHPNTITAAKLSAGLTILFPSAVLRTGQAVLAIAGFANIVTADFFFPANAVVGAGVAILANLTREIVIAGEASVVNLVTIL
jgi:hypothetical protein